MTRERAEEIRAAIWRAHGWGGGGATPAEQSEIAAFWKTLPGSCTYFDAVSMLASEDPDGARGARWAFAGPRCPGCGVPARDHGERCDVAKHDALQGRTL